MRRSIFMQTSTCARPSVLVHAKHENSHAFRGSSTPVWNDWCSSSRWRTALSGTRPSPLPPACSRFTRCWPGSPPKASPLSATKPVKESVLIAVRHRFPVHIETEALTSLLRDCDSRVRSVPQHLHRTAATCPAWYAPPSSLVYTVMGWSVSHLEADARRLPQDAQADAFDSG